MRTIIAGTRDFVSDHWLGTIAFAVTQLQDATGKKISEVFCGGATGIDTHGAAWARANEIPVRMFPADWKKHGNTAGPIRNQKMAKDADALILIWDGYSPGSRNMLATAEKRGITILNLEIDARRR